MSPDELPLVHIRVTANVDSMRRGWEGQVPLTERIEALSMSGYLQILGHVNLAPAQLPVSVASFPVAEPESVHVTLAVDTFVNRQPDGWADAAEVAAPVKVKRSRRKAVEVDDGGSPGSP